MITGWTARVVEMTDCWLLTWQTPEASGWRDCDTASEALAAVRDASAAWAERGTANVAEITWEPKTKMGRAIVRALTEA